MSSLAVCRVCLAGSVKVNCIKNSRLQDIFERLTSFKLSAQDGKPDTVCYICHRQLHKCAMFCQKRRKSGGVLAELIRNKVEITAETLKALSRGFQSFSITTLESTSYITSNQVMKEENSSDEETDLNMGRLNQVIKSESNLDCTTTSLCGLCLSADFRTLKLKNTSLQDVYEKLTGKVDQDSLPDAICYICASHLRVARNVIIKAKTSDNVLSELFYNGVQLTQSIVSILNRRTKPTYRRSTLQTLTYSPSNDDVVIVKEEMVESSLCYDTGSNGKIKSETALGQEIKIEFEMESFPEDLQQIHNNTNKRTMISHIDQYGSCDACEYRCNSEIKLKKHMKMHDPSRKYPCEHCSLRYLSENHLKLHKNRVHRKVYNCRRCNLTFWNRGKYRNHVTKHTAKCLYTCEKCQRVFDQRKKLQSHYYSVHRGLRHPCDKCNFTSTSYEWLQNHIIRVHAKSSHYICDICRKTCLTKRSIKHHLSIHYGKRYKCKLCTKVYNSNQSLNNHTRMHSGVKPYKCHMCNKAYVEKAHLKLHALTHSTKEFSCNICLKEFHRKDILKKHLDIHAAKKIYECDKCDKKFISNTYVKRHVLSHSNEKCHTCSICKKDYKSTASLKQHTKLMHETREKMYICDICKKSFTSKHYLTNHLKIHAGIKPYACETCKKCFRSKQILLLHTRTHTGEKPYGCNQCCKTFAQKPALRRHIQAHNNDRPFTCDICNKAFAEKLSLRTHKFTRHDKIDRFICNLCCKVFIDKEKLAEHLKYHKPRPFLCEKCKKTYFKLSSLTQHIRIHAVQYNCAFCDKEFDCKSNLHRHNVRQHKAICRYACNMCEAPFEALLGLNAHIRRHTGEKPFSCEMCVKSYVERRDLLHHMKVVHNKLEWFN